METTNFWHCQKFVVSILVGRGCAQESCADVFERDLSVRDDGIACIRDRPEKTPADLAPRTVRPESDHQHDKSANARSRCISNRVLSRIFCSIAAHRYTSPTDIGTLKYLTRVGHLTAIF